MTTTFMMLGSIFGIMAGVSFNLHNIYLALPCAALALISYVIALFAHLKTKHKKEGRKSMKLIGKKTVLSIGGEPPKDDPNEIITEKTVVHVPTSEVGKYDSIVGTETILIIGEDKQKDK